MLRNVASSSIDTILMLINNLFLKKLFLKIFANKFLMIDLAG